MVKLDFCVSGISRRERRHYRQTVLHYSRQSVVYQLQHFFRAMHRVSNTVLIPNRLKDLALAAGYAGQAKKLLEFDPQMDFCKLYQLLSTVHHQLCWGHYLSSIEEEQEEETCTDHAPPDSSNNNNSKSFNCEDGRNTNKICSQFSQPDAAPDLCAKADDAVILKQPTAQVEKSFQQDELKHDFNHCDKYSYGPVVDSYTLGSDQQHPADNNQQQKLHTGIGHIICQLGSLSCKLNSQSSSLSSLSSSTQSAYEHSFVSSSASVASSDYGQHQQPQHPAQSTKKRQGLLNHASLALGLNSSKLGIRFISRKIWKQFLPTTEKRTLSSASCSEPQQHEHLENGGDMSHTNSSYNRSHKHRRRHHHASQQAVPVPTAEQQHNQQQQQAAVSQERQPNNLPESRMHQKENHLQMRLNYHVDQLTLILHQLSDAADLISDRYLWIVEQSGCV